MTDCAFCSIARHEADAHVVAENDDVVAFLDRRPVFEGHTLVIPRAHVETLADLPESLLGPFFGAVQKIAAAMPEALDAHGAWVSINNVVSQSVPHLHAHVVPRRRKDGLRGFFWPRTSYANDEEMAAYARRLRAAIEL